MKLRQTRTIKKDKINLPLVSLNSPVVKENLPFPFVHYPNHYGVFISFSETIESEQFFCNCSKLSIDNYLILNNYLTKDGRPNPEFLFHHSFPNYISSKIKDKLSINEIIKFKPKLCHKCNLSTPSLRWCVEMYGGNFKQYFGWYIEQTKYTLGFKDVHIIKDKCPEEILDLIKNNTYSGTTDIRYDSENECYEVTEYATVEKALHKYAENIIRVEFGFRQVGESWISESILFYIIKKLYPNTEIERHYRPVWLSGLELDIYIPSLSLAFEYQGHQHYKPVEAWGGKKAFKKLQERDKLKKELCIVNRVTLIEIDYTEPLSEDFVLNKITAHNTRFTPA